MIVPMKRLTLIGLKAEEEGVMKALQALGSVEILSTEALTDDVRLANVRLDDVQLNKLQAEVDRLEAARKTIKPYYKKPKLAPPPRCTEAELRESREKGGDLCAQIEELDRELSAKRAEAERHLATAHSLEPFEAMPTPIEEIRPTRHIRYLAGVTDQKGLETVRSLGEILETEIGLEEYPGATATAVLIACYAIDRDAILRALKETSFAEFTFPKLTGTPEENIRREREEAARLQEECEGIEQSLGQKAAQRVQLEMAADSAAIERDRALGQVALGQTEYAYILDGWLRADKEEETRAAIEGITDAFYMETRDPLDDEIPPSVTKNSKLAEPYESIVSMYALPSYRGIDATPALAPFYFLFFGMMLSDSGYGIALFLGGLLYSKYLRPKGNTAKLVKVITYGGLSALLCGPFIGTFFGIEWNDIFHTTVFPLLFDPMTDVMQMMILSCGLGLVHMFTGIGIKMYMCFRDGDWQSAIFDQLSWMLLITGLIALFAFPAIKTASLVLIGLGGGMLLLFSGRSSKNPIKRVGKGLSALYNITGYLSDILSYVRIFALGLVSGAMGMVFNLIGGMIYNAFSGLGIPGVILGVVFAGGILAALHVFSLFINTLGAYAHTARLQFIEFFGKFYEADGVAFKPLRINLKNVDLEGK